MIAFADVKLLKVAYGGYTVSIARETVHQTCDHGAQELNLMNRLEVSFITIIQPPSRQRFPLV